jgi:hypothetical protein
MKIKIIRTAVVIIQPIPSKSIIQSYSTLLEPVEAGGDIGRSARKSEEVKGLGHTFCQILFMLT